MQELLVDFVTSLDGYASAEGWPGWWGLEGPEYLGWLDEQPERDNKLLMGAKTYRLMSGFATEPPAGASADEADTLSELTSTSKVVFSSSLQAPLSWANTELVSGDAIQAVREMKQNGTSPMRTIGSLGLCRSLLQAGLVDRFRVVVFPVITGKSGSERIYDGYPDVGLDMLNSRTFDGRIQLLEYAPRVLDGPPGTNAGA
jgi:dihydrofolate reductase